MNAIGRSASCLALAALAAVLAAVGCASVEPKAERGVAPPVGSTWTIEQRNSGSYGKDAQVQVTRGEGTWQGKPVAAYANSGGNTMMVTSEGSWIAFVGRDGKPMLSFDPPLGWQYPLMVGKTWTAKYRMTMHAANKTVDFDMSCRVEGYENVTVKAGTFPAFRIACTNGIGNEDTMWTSPDLGIFVKTKLKRTDKSVFGPGTQEAELIAQTIRK
jgi:hypothetical protein